MATLRSKAVLNLNVFCLSVVFISVQASRQTVLEVHVTFVTESNKRPETDTRMSCTLQYFMDNCDIFVGKTYGHEHKISYFSECIRWFCRLKQRILLHRKLARRMNDGELSAYKITKNMLQSVIYFHHLT